MYKTTDTRARKRRRVVDATSAQVPIQRVHNTKPDVFSGEWIVLPWALPPGDGRVLVMAAVLVRDVVAYGIPSILPGLQTPYCDTCKCPTGSGTASLSKAQAETEAEAEVCVGAGVDGNTGPRPGLGQRLRMRTGRREVANAVRHDANALTVVRHVHVTPYQSRRVLGCVVVTPALRASLQAFCGSGIVPRVYAAMPFHVRMQHRYARQVARSLLKTTCYSRE
jgi:hypothetical protein